MNQVAGRVLVVGAARGDVLRFTRPISLWGGVDPRSGVVIDQRHPQRGERLSGRIALFPGTIGSSSSSAILLELLRNSCAPVGIILDRADAILTLGVVVARELGYPTIPVIEADIGAVAALVGRGVEITPDGVIRPFGVQTAR